MRAAACRPGHKDSIRVIDMERPECGRNEVLVRDSAPEALRRGKEDIKAVVDIA